MYSGSSLFIFIFSSNYCLNVYKSALKKCKSAKALCIKNRSESFYKLNHNMPPSDTSQEDHSSGREHSAPLTTPMMYFIGSVLMSIRS